MSKLKGLGKGLNALFTTYEKEENNQVYNDRGSVDEIAIKLIRPNINQPRKKFEESSLKELADSIKIHGIIQPLVLTEEEDHYMIIAGERRYRAAKIAGLEYVPAIIKNYTPKQVKEISLIENLQREDLNPVEAARAIKELMEEYKLKQEDVAERIGKSRTAIANILRLLSLTPEVIKMVEEEQLSAGHARTLVVITNPLNQIKIATLAKENKISVRDMEKIVRKYLNPKSTKVTQQSIELKDLTQQMQRVFGTKVSVIGNDNKGRIYIDYYTKDDLDRINQLLQLVSNKTLTLKDLNNFNKTNKV